MSKMNSCFEEFFHRNCCQNFILLVYVLGEAVINQNAMPMD